MCIQGSGSATVETWWWHGTSTFRRRNAWPHWPWCGLLEKKSCSQTRQHFMSRVKFTGIMCAYGVPKTHMLLGSRYAPQNMARARIWSGCYPCYQRSPHRGLLRSVKNFHSFAVICHKPHVATSICLRATIFQNPEWTLWTHCILLISSWTRDYSKLHR
jgi:hypothetical protein